MPRNARKTPVRDESPLDPYTPWDIRIARAFYWFFMVGFIIIVVGLLITIVMAIDQQVWAAFADLETGFQVAIIAGVILLILIILVLLYAIFHGGVLRMCKMLYKNRIIAKKYEDHTTLRYLMGVVIIFLYIFVFALIIALLTQDFWPWVAGVWDWMVKNFLIGHWILYFGAVILCVVLFFFFMFVLWNHGVYWVLRIVYRVREEEEIDNDIYYKKVQNMSEEERHKEYRKRTGKNAAYRGMETKAYAAWKKKMGC